MAAIITVTYAGMPAAGSLLGSEIFPIIQNGANCQTTLSNMGTFIVPQPNAVLPPPLNLVMSVPTTSQTATITADQISLSISLGVSPLVLSSFNQTINLAITGAGGMDTGTATANEFLAVYAIYNPGSATSSTLCQVVNSSVAPEIYAGGHMPTGYTYSRLITVWLSGATGYFTVGYQQGRTVWIPEVFYTPGNSIIAWTSVSIGTSVPANAKTCSGRVAGTYPATAGPSAAGYGLSPQGSTLGQQLFSAYDSSSYDTGGSFTFGNLLISSSQTIYYEITGANWDSGVGFGISSYSF